MVYPANKQSESSEQQSSDRAVLGSGAGDTGGDSQGLGGQPEKPTGPIGSERSASSSEQAGEAASTEDKEQPTEKEDPLVRKTVFFKESVFQWLEYWAAAYGMRSPSQFLNELLAKIIAEENENEEE